MYHNNIYCVGWDAWEPYLVDVVRTMLQALAGRTRSAGLARFASYNLLNCVIEDLIHSSSRANVL